LDGVAVKFCGASFGSSFCRHGSYRVFDAVSEIF